MKFKLKTISMTVAMAVSIDTFAEQTMDLATTDGGKYYGRTRQNGRDIRSIERDYCCRAHR